ncbi:hypothetical protein Trydic_g11508 [Trypoxylus dichotomus]
MDKVWCNTYPTGRLVLDTSEMYVALLSWLIPRYSIFLHQSVFILATGIFRYKSKKASVNAITCFSVEFIAGIQELLDIGEMCLDKSGRNLVMPEWCNYRSILRVNVICSKCAGLANRN